MHGKVWTKATNWGDARRGYPLVCCFISRLYAGESIDRSADNILGRFWPHFLSAVGVSNLAVFVIFIGRLITAPARIYAELKATIPQFKIRYWDTYRQYMGFRDG